MALFSPPSSGRLFTTLPRPKLRDGQEKSLALGQREPDAFDLYCLAMGYARLGEAERAKHYFDRAVQWAATQKNLEPSVIEELEAFRAEAEPLVMGK